MAKRSDPIGVLDSGVGGISVLSRLVRQLPGEQVLYFGDSRNAPYGTRPGWQVRELTLAAAKRLVDQGIKALVVACNTATAEGLEALKQQYPHLIIQGIEPPVRLAAQRYRRIGVMATEVTLASARLQEQLTHCPEAWIHRIPVPGLVELVEQGKGEGPEARALLEQVLGPWRGQLDVLILGCTHYPFAAGNVRAVLGPEPVLLDGADITVENLRRALEKEDLLSPGPGQVLFENSKNDPEILEISRKLYEIHDLEE